MITATVEEVRNAYRAFRRINEETRLPQKPAWRISRLLGKLKPVVVSFEETQLKLFLDAGGHQAGGGVQIDGPEREEGEPAADWRKRFADHREKLNKLNEEIRALNAENVEIDYDAIPLALFEDDEKTPAEKRRQFSANDFADCGQFITDEPEKPK